MCLSLLPQTREATGGPHSAGRIGVSHSRKRTFRYLPTCAPKPTDLRLSDGGRKKKAL